ncbi:MAG: glycosyltransferase family 4 protein [Deltaproteobacteria bacterium]
MISSTGFFGAENVVSQLSGALSVLGHRVSIGVISDGREPVWPTQGKMPVTFFPCRGKFDPGTIAAIRRYMREKSIAVVNTHNYKSDMYGWLASIGTDARKVATCHNWITRGPKMRIYESIDKGLLRLFDAVIAVSPALHEEIAKSGISPMKIRTIPNGIGFSGKTAEKDRLRLRQENCIEAGIKAVLSVGRLSREKGHDVLLRAFAALIREGRQLKLIVVGEGGQRAMLEELSERLGLKGQVVFTGFRNDVRMFLDSCDIFVLPSFTEAMPMALVEALSAGIPVVATKVGAVPDILQEGKYGLLTSPGDPDGMAAAIRNILADPASAADRAEKGRRHCRNTMSSRRMAQEYARVYSGHG